MGNAARPTQLFLYVYLLYRQCKFILFQSVFEIWTVFYFVC